MASMSNRNINKLLPKKSNVLHARTVAGILERKYAGLVFIDEMQSKIGKLKGMQDVALQHTIQIPLADISGSTELADWHAPTAGKATRQPGTKSAGTSRGWNFFKENMIWHESNLEDHTALKILSRTDIADFQSQYPVLHFKDDEGKVHKHTCDGYVRFSDGLELGLVVKHQKKEEEMLDMMARIRTFGTNHVVHDIVLLTEHYANWDTSANAELILWSREHHNDEDVGELLTIVKGLHGKFRFGELYRGCPDFPRRNVAIWRLIDLGILIPPRNERITDLTWLNVCTTN